MTLRKSARYLSSCLVLLAGLSALVSDNAVSGTAAAEELQWRVVDQDGAPLAGAVLTVTDGSTRPVVLQQPALMSQEQQQFSPQVLVVPVGANVAIPNKDATLHHVYSFSPAKVFELKLYRGNDHAPLRFDTPGLVELGCNIHDAMRGYIVVTEDPIYGVSDADGWVRVAVSPDGFDMAKARATLWHARQLQPIPAASINAGDQLTIAVRTPSKPVRRGLKGWGSRK